MTPVSANGWALALARWLLLLYVALLPVVRPLDTRILGIHVLAIDLIFVVLFGAWLLGLRRTRFFVSPRYIVCGGAYFLALCLSAAFSLEPTKSAFKLLGVFYLVILSVIVADLVRDLSFLKKIFVAWLIGSVITLSGIVIGLASYYSSDAMIGTNFFLFGFGSLPAGPYPRVRGFFENPNMTANYINVAVMLMLGAGMAKWISKKLAFSISALLIVFSVFTISPGLGGIVLSLGLMTAFSVFNLSARRRWLVLGPACFIASLALLSSAVSPYNRENEYTVTLPLIQRRVEPSVRAVLWQQSFYRGLEYPLLGRGTGTDAADLKYQVVSGQQQWLRDAHQAWLNVFAQSGIIGLIAFSALCLYLFSTCRFRFQDLSDERTAIHLACSCAFVGAFLFQNLFGSYEDARHLWVLIGMLVGLSCGREQY